MCTRYISDVQFVHFDVCLWVLLSCTASSFASLFLDPSPGCILLPSPHYLWWNVICTSWLPVHSLLLVPIASLVPSSYVSLFPNSIDQYMVIQWGWHLTLLHELLHESIPHSSTYHQHKIHFNHPPNSLFWVFIFKQVDQLPMLCSLCAVYRVYINIYWT